MNALLVIAAHMVGDYILQTDHMAANKLTDWKVRTLHVATYTLAFVPVAFLVGLGWMEGALFLLAVAVPHWLVDSRRWVIEPNWPPKPILVDQAMHACFLAAAALAFDL